MVVSIFVELKVDFTFDFEVSIIVSMVSTGNDILSPLINSLSAEMVF